jgi:sugar phosphate isomerase/epimerase
LGTNLIVSFGFDRGGLPPGEAPEEVLAYLHQAAECVEQAKMSLAIEVEEGHWADTGWRTADIIRAVDHPALKVNWDPGNTAPSGEKPYPQGYKAVRDYVQHVHVKDVILHPDGGYHYAIEGDINWEGQLQALSKDGYDGFLSVETHMRPKVKNARAMLERLRGLLSQLEEKH